MRRRTKEKHVSGFVSILGRPNAGKSTLLNALLGTKLAIVAARPQTTRTRIQGVWTTHGAQVVFADTPGVHEAQTVFNQRMMKAVGEALDAPDLVLLVIDSTRPPGGADDETALRLVRRAGAPALALFNKVDALERRDALLPLIDHYRGLHGFASLIPISALTGEGLEALRGEILARMPEGPAYFPPDHLTDQPERFLAAEIIREKALALTRQEVPHAVAVLVEEWKEEGRLLRISAAIHVERRGQKAIVVGAGGAMLKRIGTQARLELESMTGRKVFLSLFVKVSEKWREDPRFLDGLDWRTWEGPQ
jgi:GTP-binding protein Era